MMNFDNLPIYLALLALLSSPAVYGDPLNPGMLGETMDMPLPPDLVAKAVRAGVITSASEVTGSLPSGGQAVNLGTPTVNDPAASQDGASDAAVSLGSAGAAGAAESVGAAGPISAGSVNLGTVNADPSTSQAQGTEAGSSLNGTLSLVLQDSATRYLTLALQQTGDMIMGQGNMTSGSSVQDVTASGLVTGGQLSLTVTPAVGSDIYKLELMPEGNTIKGSYSAQSEEGATWSGTAVGILPGNSLEMSAPMTPLQITSVPTTQVPTTSASKTVEPHNLGATVGGVGASSSTAASAGPVQLGQSMGGGSSFSSSKSISMSMNGGGSMISSTSSTSF